MSRALAFHPTGCSLRSSLKLALINGGRATAIPLIALCGEHQHVMSGCSMQYPSDGEQYSSLDNLRAIGVEIQCRQIGHSGRWKAPCAEKI
jgi:hypothetical protein